MHILLRGTTAQRVRLASGLVLMTFTATHFANHALGLAGLDVMVAAERWRLAVTRSPPGTAILAMAILVHAGLALFKLARRATLRMPVWEAVQIATGLAIPYLLIQHVAFNRGAHEIAGTDDTYRYELATLWPDFAWAQSTLLLLVWVHGTIGLHYWLRLHPAWRRWQAPLLAAATAMPILALTGFIAAGREVAASLTVPGARDALYAAARAPDAEAVARIVAIEQAVQWTFLALAALALAVPLMRMALRASAGRMSVKYVAGPLVRALPGPTLLEISRMSGVPHAAVCGGRARCSTCRVAVASGLDELPPPEAAELRTLESVGAPPGVRLACQVRPRHDLTVRRIVAPHAARASRAPEEQGIERPLAILFFDLRGYTALSEARLPYDVVFLLNGIFSAVAGAIEAHGGRIDKYMGDGLMAAFGHDAPLPDACRGALRATREIDRVLADYSERYRDEIGRTLACAMGLHAGALVIGRIGAPGSATLTVIGRPVNAASRLESLAKERGAQLAVSADVLAAAGLAATGLPVEQVAIRGLVKPLRVALVTQARDLPAI
ncbi:MAG: adenylate/guanylate cyclase domain-containing protein [Hyphomicrobiaceae bacterium]